MRGGTESTINPTLVDLMEPQDFGASVSNPQAHDFVNTRTYWWRRARISSDMDVKISLLPQYRKEIVSSDNVAPVFTIVEHRTSGSHGVLDVYGRAYDWAACEKARQSYLRLEPQG